MYVADLHIHSKYSLATSKDGDAPHLDQWARYKGIGLLGTGDFTHPVWRQELGKALEPAADGLYRLRPEQRLSADVAGERGDPFFVLSGEISTIYKQDGKTRKVHHVILLPSLEAAEELSHRLEAIGNIHSDGRPILGLSSRDLLAITLDACPEAIFIPAHIWTPHFSLFGAFSCFETLEECYGDRSGCIHALETGLSSDPPMNRMVSMLDKYTLVSNSDAHSPAKLGREANLLSCERSYPALKRALETGEGFEGTLEFFPEEGKYHLDGHRNCACCLEPSETAALDGRCPVCGRKLTVGVLHRVEELADRKTPIPCDKPFESLMPLEEVLGNCLNAGPQSKRVSAAYFELLKRFGPELFILREMPLETAEKGVGFAFGEALRRLRAGLVEKVAGYDGEYGKVLLFKPHELELLSGQTTLLGLGEAGTKRKTLKPPVPPKAKEEKPEEDKADHLNELQERAANSTAAVTAVIAGPGTGKTKTLVERIAWLVERQGAAPGEITAVTFTNQAAGEMRERLEKRLGKAAGGLTIGTFHHIALNLLPKKPLVSREQAKEILGELIEERGEKLSPSAALAAASREKNGLCAATPLTLAYQERVKALSMRDLDDVLLEALEWDVTGNKAFTHLLVDEFQDINGLQHGLVERWSAQGQSLFVIGDPDQSIYGFRGADAECFAKLLCKHPGALVVPLEENYRSAPAVLQNAVSVISHNPGRERRLHANRAPGARVRMLTGGDPFSEGVFVAKEIAQMAGGVDMLSAHGSAKDQTETRAFSEIAVLCRTRRQLDQIEFCLRHDDIPCVVCGREDFWEDGKVLGLLGFFRSLEEPGNAASLRDALANLWKYPAPLRQQAEAALRQQKTFDAAALRQRLAPFPLLTPWLDAAEELLPKLSKQKPRKLLETLAERTGAQTKAVQKLLDAAVFHPRMDAFLQAVLLGEEGDLRRQSGASYQSGAVRLMTLHGAKGLEFPVVFLCGATKGELPLERMESDTDVSEERRLFFVGMTRARDELLITCGGEPSPFLAELCPDTRRETLRSYRPSQKLEQITFF